MTNLEELQAQSEAIANIAQQHLAYRRRIQGTCTRCYLRPAAPGISVPTCADCVAELRTIAAECNSALKARV